MTIEEELERLWLSLEHTIIDALITFPDRKAGIANWLRVAAGKVEFGLRMATGCRSSAAMGCRVAARPPFGNGLLVMVVEAACLATPGGAMSKPAFSSAAGSS